MNIRRCAVIAVLLCVACGGDDNGTGPGSNNNPTEPDAVATPAGTPNGTPVTQTIGAAGGSVASSDGALTLSVPAGALASNTDITIQPITNTAWGGVGGGYQLTPDGLTFAVPVSLEFEVPDGALEGSTADGLDVAVQNADGYWFVLKNRTYDEAGGTITCTTTHFSSYAVIQELQLQPTMASVGPSTSVDLHIVQCFYEEISQDPNVSVAVLTCSDADPELAPLIQTSNWSVNGIGGGNSTVGRLSNVFTSAARYTAPAAPPVANPVAVSVNVRVRRGQALLVSNITITSGFSGTITHNGPNGDKTVYTVTWTSEGSLGEVESFSGVGTAVYTPYTEDGCETPVLTPSQGPLTTDFTYMIINRSAQPLQVTITAVADWDVHECTTCGSDPPVCGDYHFFVAFDDGTTGTISQDGNTITGYFLDVGSGENWTYQFTRP